VNIPQGKRNQHANFQY